MFVMPLLAEEFTNITDIKGCRAIVGESERLLCYDTVSAGGIFNEQKLKQVQVEKFGSDKMQKAPAETTPSVVGEATATPPTKTTAPPAVTDISVDKLAVRIVRSKKDNFGFYYFQTSDGQVWKQQNAGSWSVTVPFDAEIKAGAFGSFFLVNEGGKSTRVKRLK